MRVAYLVAVALMASPAALAAEPRPLSFSVNDDVYTVPSGGLETIELMDAGGLRLCPTHSVEEAIAAFTMAHRGEIVAVRIGEIDVFRLEIVKPYGGGCISWPVHPKVAAVYRGLLLGDQEDN